MGMFDRIFQKKDQVKAIKAAQGYFKTLTAYQPSFTTWNGALYEELLVRASVDAIARHASKLDVKMVGSAFPELKKRTEAWPNDWMTWSQFLYRLATILEMQTTAWIVPVLNDKLEVDGYFPLLPANVDVLDVHGKPWIRYRFRNGELGYMEMSRVGIMTRMQYEDDLFGGGNGALRDTVSLMNLQRQGIKEGIKNGATFRFIANAGNVFDGEDLVKEMRRFNRKNLQEENGGLLLFPYEYQNVKQIEPKSFKLDAEEVKIIENNVNMYFGTNTKILLNQAAGDEWAAFFDGKLEPFAIQLGQVMSKMTFTPTQIRKGDYWMVTANRLQYASTNEKLQVSAQMADRGVMNRNEIRAIWGLPPIPGPEGEMYLVRGEYKDAAGEVVGQQNEGGSEDEQGNADDGV